MKGLTAKLQKYLSKQPKSLLLTFGIILVMFLGVIDYLTGVEIGFSIFYGVG